MDRYAAMRRAEDAFKAGEISGVEFLLEYQRLGAIRWVLSLAQFEQALVRDRAVEAEPVKPPAVPVRERRKAR
jgi:hypothetical protein